jgi:carbamoyl-phosphate synthase small subunit
VRGFVIEELSEIASNWRSEMGLDEYLKKWSIPGIQGIDTRALTRHLRERGAMRACLTTENIEPDEAVERAQQGEGMVGQDFVREVTTKAPYEWDPDDKQSRIWTIVKGDNSNIEIDENGEAFEKLPPAKYHVVAYDFGIKHNILRMLAERGCRLTVVPATTSARDALALKPDGVFLSNGPGDPEPCDYAIDAIRTFLKTDTPTFGICLGHQLLGLATGARTVKMKFGHHGANHPVLDKDTGQVLITSQNHGFAVDMSTLAGNVRVTHVSLFDGSLQGIALTDKPAFSFQGHPEASPGPHDLAYLFDRFLALMERPALVAAGQ